MGGLQAGFLGVDVFFVITGFLIITLVASGGASFLRGIRIVGQAYAAG
jgi:peptidoglycan/LPS O-acetylase OafA/YrhL